MIRYVLSFVLFCFFSVISFAGPIQKDESQKITHVVYVTFDGTRWQDFFQTHEFFSKFWQKYSASVTLYGDPKSSVYMDVASIPVSLPSYQSQMAGSVQPCSDNGCGRIAVETLTENILHTLKLRKKDVATFSSWPEIGLAVEHIMGTTYANTGNMLVTDPNTGLPDSEMARLNDQQAIDHPGGGDRYDKYTFAQALHYLEKYQPKFLWISLDDADEAAHQNNVDLYRDTLRSYDSMLDVLFGTLKKLGLYEETLVIVTTDHGRGSGGDWDEHGPRYPESAQTWAFVLHGELKEMEHGEGWSGYNTLSIRPAIEAALGV